MFTLNPDEKVIKVIRKHWFVLILQTINVVLIFLAPLLLLYLVLTQPFFPDISERFLTTSTWLFIFGMAFWGLVWWLNFFGFWTDHYLDGLIITDKRIIEIEQHGFFRRTISSFRMERIQDVTSEIPGIIGTIFRFGTIRIQTAGHDQEFILRFAPNPSDVRQTILDELDKTMEHRAVRGDIDAPSPLG